MKALVKNLILTLAALMIVGCSPGHTEKVAQPASQGNPPEAQPVIEPAPQPGEPIAEPGEPVPEPIQVVLDYATVNTEVLFPECVKCHKVGGRVMSLETYADVLQNIVAIRSEVAGGTMPPRSVLSDADKKLLLDWIDAGAPEVAAVNPVIEP